MMARRLAELRLVFHVMTDPEQFHRPYLGRNRVIAVSFSRSVTGTTWPLPPKKLIVFV